MGGYSATKAGLEGLVGSLQMDSRAPASARPSYGPGPTWSDTGMDWDPDAAAAVLTSG